MIGSRSLYVGRVLNVRFLNLKLTMTRIFYDLSHQLNAQCSIYPGDPVFCCKRVATVAKDQFNVSALSLGSHTGTHLDAPYHFFDSGITVDQLDLSTLVSLAYIVDVSDACGPRGKIPWSAFERFDTEIRSCSILLIHTGWSRFWSSPTYFDHPFLDAEVASKLLERGVKVVGIDTLSPDETILDGSEGSFAVHEVLLGSGVVIVENLTNLRNLVSKKLMASLLPLNLEGCDGSPIRAVAWTD